MLRVTLAINADTIADYEVRRVEDSLYAKTEHRYEIRPILGGTTGAVLGSVWHYEQAGPASLAAKAVTASATARRVRATASSEGEEMAGE